MAGVPKVGTLPIVRKLGVIALLWAGSAACNGVLGLQDYEVRPAVTDTGTLDTGALDTGTADATSGDTCFDPTGNGGHGCFRCEAGTEEQLMNACTSSPCYAFDDFKRIPGYTGDAAALPDVIVDDVAEAAVSDSSFTAPTTCSSFPSPVYVYGSTAMLGVLSVLSQQLVNRTIIYQAAPSCDGLNSILFGVDVKMRKAVTTTAYAGGTSTPCVLDGDRSPDIGISDVEPRMCKGVVSTESITEARGPIQVFMFAAPTASSQRAISREGAFRTFGFGSVAGIAPWINDLLILRRHVASGTQITIANFIGLPVDRWAGVRVESSGTLAKNCSEGMPAEQTVCITSADQRDFKFKDSLRNLAYKHEGQLCAFLPDSIEGGVDKRNVRDGHYVLWAPVHFFVVKGALADDAIRDVHNALTGVKLPSDKVDSYFVKFKEAGLVPTCAMRVARDTDYGALKSSLPEVPCGCAFESAGVGIPTGCKPCSAPTDCGKDETCSFGFCERRKI